ncbi:shufflon system plasmid conjugative transfer pilus tip adhesin PilV [Yersinia ruckeri]|uniref:shufflon system plasmid conjugative transfer pilus tip adhesin PilV n=1 Tax=Yersinia ruckeri TaxID=29486 RepID=UPI0022387767|nr:shufflon system plasmid conjugative transfer pilus tip adhesin PilV [Yersinia ruckeri]MCW6572905.1 shufflon system plasmid conjugative transfer pilus tip adhesin PilV [Yersinia ruckeri]
MKKFKKGLAAISGQTIALIAGLIVLATITVPAVNLLQRDQSYSVAASHANRVEKAVNKYILEQSAIVGAGSTASSPYTIDVPLLISKGYLPGGFAAQNNFSSTYKTLVFQPSTQKFHSMTFLEGGTQLSMSAARKLATRIGDSGGVIENGVANGVQGLWSENLSAFGGFNPGDGHVVIAGFFSNGSVVNEYLYRKAVPGHPELNTMSTALNMGANDINAIRNINATGNAAVQGNITAGNTVAATSVTATGTVKAATTDTSGETYTGGWYRTRGDTGWYSEKWGGGWHMTDGTWLRAYGGKSIYTAGIVQAATFQPGQISVVNTACPENGRISRDGVGATLSCQSGVWKLGAGSGQFGGVFMTNGNSCKVKNTLTGACTCLSNDYTTQWIAANDPAPGNDRGKSDMTFLCVKP